MICNVSNVLQCLQCLQCCNVCNVLSCFAKQVGTLNDDDDDGDKQQQEQLCNVLQMLSYLMEAAVALILIGSTQFQ